jgi:hypothetical protein
MQKSEPRWGDIIIDLFAYKNQNPEGETLFSIYLHTKIKTPKGRHYYRFICIQKSEPRRGDIIFDLFSYKNQTPKGRHFYRFICIQKSEPRRGDINIGYFEYKNQNPEEVTLFSIYLHTKIRTPKG